ncbi:MAG: FKBP-type peptidyl-prolyl cis-trans isomerase [Paludibacteraceae bacterium]|nr:FKBP-type peptidyl-prolyl cis-trans isomerase [Paludibacteraceae bacterium]MBQ2608413.1 FKBP-type peptidyl-prolyl cis-trans isomerase [Paludibacteraceae bacterium]
MKRIFFFLALALLMTGCKENNWTEWKVQNELWLQRNLEQDSMVKVTASGLQYKILADPTPTDAKPSRTSYVTCDYTLTLINGNKLEGGHGTFALSSVISGFAEGCCLIHNNGDIRIFVPYYLGYDEEKVNDNDTYNAVGNEGTEGTHSYIPPYSTLIYDIHICSVSGSN